MGEITVKGRKMRGLVVAVILFVVACSNPTSSNETNDPGGANAPFEGILVTSAASGGPGSLRQAVIDAESGEEIRFAEDMTILLEGDRRGIEIDKDITINGVGRTVVIEGSGEQRHFTHMPGGPYTLTIANLTLRNGEPRMGGLLPGGSIYIAGGSTATIENVTFHSNLGTNGGAIFVEAPHGTATVHVTGSTFTNNEARGFSGTQAPAGSGGAIYAMDTNLVIGNSLFEGNLTLQGNTQQPDPISGGAIAINSGNLSSVRDSIFRSNTAGLYGGAIAARNSSLDVIDSVFEENRAGVNGTAFLHSPATGGAIHTLNQGSGVIRIGFSRFIRNRAQGPHNAAATRMLRGGAISNFGQPLAVFSSEFFGNYVGDTGSTGQGGSIATNSGSAIYHIATSPMDGMVISSSAFVGNVASGAGYGEGTAQGSAVASESASILYDISFSTFAGNVGTAGHQHFWFAGEQLYLTNSAFQFSVDDELTLPAPSSPSDPVVQRVVAPSSAFAFGEAWHFGNTHVNPLFSRNPSSGPDGIWGTTDDDYGDLLPLESSDSGDDLFYDSPLIDLGDAADLPPDIMDLNGNGNTSEPLPFDARGNPRQSGSAPDIGAYER